MCMTDRFDSSDDRHLEIKHELMHGIALKDIATTDEVDRTLQQVGFEVVEGVDRAVGENDSITPWYQPMESLNRTLGYAVFRNPVGRRVFIWGTKLAEGVGMFPKGSAEVVKLLNRTANAYVAGGKSGIFTPLYCFLARKPL